MVSTVATSQSNARVVSREEWLKLRQLHLAREKAHTRERDELARQRRELPWVRVDKDYRFDTPAGPRTLADLFDGRSQLVVYHFMFGPEWQEGCPSCSFVCDHADGALPHLAARDVTFVAVSRAPMPKIAAFKQRMRWKFPWVSSHGSDFNYDFNVSFTPDEKASGPVHYNYKLQDFPSDEGPGLSAFYRDPSSGEIFHTYSTYARGLEPLVTAYMILDLAPKGRDEDDLPFSMAWVRHHDRYAAAPVAAFADADKPYWPRVETPAAATTPASAATTSCGCGNGTADRKADE
jgi:predicted dithiol-disulfide oxidoreductase (DUF899 family)